ncbi:Cell division trigger factor [hydrothermal vent metagenome]|uniref:peptidylprolyl isomerase n=1 Tax=hydrothermal vent metagenome TaxID=652676 RepID=A0A3B1A7B2_9ZZZZ
MQVSVETTQGLERRMMVEINEEQIAEAVETRLKSMAKTTKIKGFRAGKVPFKVVKQHYGGQVRQEIVSDLVQSTFYEAVTQEKLRPAGGPTIGNDLVATDGLKYTATFEVYPEVEIASFDGVTLEKETAEISDADVAEMIETIRKQNKTWKAVDTASDDGNQVTVDFAGSVDGEAFEGGTGTDMAVEIGAGRMIPGFEDGLKGLKKGDETTLSLTFPENYPQKELAAKPVEFKITVKAVEQTALPEIDEDFAKKMGVEDGNIEQMNKDIRENMQRELDAKIKTNLKQVAMDKLIDLHKMDVPKALIEQEAATLMQQMQQNFASQGMKESDIQLNPDMFNDQASRRVSLGLIMAEVVKENDIKVDDEKVRAKVEEIAEPYDQPEQVVSWYYGDKQRLNEIESLVFEEQIIEWLLSKVTVEEKTKKFKELMQPEAKQAAS